MAKDKLLEQDNDFISYLFGLNLAILSSIFIGISFIIKKKALKKLECNGHLRASSGGYSYLKEWMWWLGLLTMGIGEGANLLAYAFVPAALVTPLGALSILVTAILSSKFLDEKLNLVAKIGCGLCIIGSIILILHSPNTENVRSFSEITVRLFDTIFISYVFFVMCLFIIVQTLLVPKYGKLNIFVYLIICSAIGSLSVVFCKAVALGIKDGVSIQDTEIIIFSSIFTLAIVGIVIQINYLNKSLDLFKTNIVTPIYYVMFTSLTIISSGILFKEWIYMQYGDILGCIIGFIILVFAVFTLNANKMTNSLQYKSVPTNIT